MRMQFSLQRAQNSSKVLCTVSTFENIKNLHFPADNRSHCKTRKFPVRKSVLIPFRIRFDVPI